MSSIDANATERDENTGRVDVGAKFDANIMTC